MKKADARTAALQALLQVEESEGYSNIVIDKTIRRMELDSREAGLASALFYGVLEKRIALDWALGRFSKKPMEKLDAPVRELLRLGAYQIFFMDKIPDSAAVNEAVNGCRQAGKASAAGFVNGVLRSLLRQKDSLPWPKEGDEALSIRYGCPVHWIRFWKKAYGEAFCLRMLARLSHGGPALPYGGRGGFFPVPAGLVSRPGPFLPVLLSGRGGAARYNGGGCVRRAGRKVLYHWGRNGKPGNSLFLRPL